MWVELTNVALICMVPLLLGRINARPRKEYLVSGLFMSLCMLGRESITVSLGALVVWGIIFFAKRFSMAKASSAAPVNGSAEGDCSAGKVQPSAAPGLDAGQVLVLGLMAKRVSFVLLIFSFLIFAMFYSFHSGLPVFCQAAGLEEDLVLPSKLLVALGSFLGPILAGAFIDRRSGFLGGIVLAVLGQLALCILVETSQHPYIYILAVLVYGIASTSLFIIMPAIIRDYFGEKFFGRVYVPTILPIIATIYFTTKFVNNIPATYPGYSSILIFFLISLAFGALFLFLAWQRRFVIVRVPQRRKAM